MSEILSTFVSEINKMKITEEELNIAYSKVNALKNSGSAEREIEVSVDRNPLTDSNFFSEDSQFAMPVKLKFEFDGTMGSKGSYILKTEVEVIGEDDEE